MSLENNIRVRYSSMMHTAQQNLAGANRDSQPQPVISIKQGGSDSLDDNQIQLSTEINDQTSAAEIYVPPLIKAFSQGVGIGRMPGLFLPTQLGSTISSIVKIYPKIEYRKNQISQNKLSFQNFLSECRRVGVSLASWHFHYNSRFGSHSFYLRLFAINIEQDENRFDQSPNLVSPLRYFFNLDYENGSKLGRKCFSVENISVNEANLQEAMIEIFSHPVGCEFDGDSPHHPDYGLIDGGGSAGGDSSMGP